MFSFLRVPLFINVHVAVSVGKTCSTEISACTVHTGLWGWVETRESLFWLEFGRMTVYIIRQKSEIKYSARNSTHRAVRLEEHNFAHLTPQVLHLRVFLHPLIISTKFLCGYNAGVGETADANSPQNAPQFTTVHLHLRIFTLTF